MKTEIGDRAVLVTPSINLIRQISLVDEAAAQDAFEAIKKALPGNGWVELAAEKVTEDDFEGVAYQVAVNDKGEYEICDRTGHPYKNVPPVKISDPDAANTVVKRLVHLAKYHATAELDNRDKSSPMADKLVIKWLGTSDVYGEGDDIPPESQLNKFPDPSNRTVIVGEYVFLLIQNTYSQALNVAVLDIASDWSVEQIYPNKGENFTTKLFRI